MSADYINIYIARGGRGGEQEQNEYLSENMRKTWIYLKYNNIKKVESYFTIFVSNFPDRWHCGLGFSEGIFEA